LRGAGCWIAKISQSTLAIRAVAGDLTTGKIVSAEHYGPAHDFTQIGIACANEILARCAEHGINSLWSLRREFQRKNYIAAPDRYQAFPKIIGKRESLQRPEDRTL